MNEEAAVDLQQPAGRATHTFVIGTSSFEVTIQWKHEDEGGRHVTAQAKIDFSREFGKTPTTAGTIKVTYRVARSNGRTQAYQKLQTIRYQEHPKYSYLEIVDNGLHIVDLSKGMDSAAYNELSQAVALFNQVTILLPKLKKMLK